MVTAAGALRAAFDRSLTAQAILGTDGRYAAVNRAFCGLVDRPATDLVGRTRASITHPDDHDRDRAAIQRLTSGEVASMRVEKRFLRPDESIVWVAIDASIMVDDHGAPGYLLTQAEPLHRFARPEELTLLGSHFDTLAASLPVGVWRTFVDGRSLESNSRWRELFDLDPGPGPMTGWEWVERLHEEDRERILGRMEQRTAQPRPYEGTYRVRWRDGSVHHIRTMGNPVFERDGTHIGFVGASEDVTERVVAEERLAEARERFRLAFENAPIGMAIVAPDGTWTSVNQALVELLGYTAEQLATMTFQDVTHPDDLDADLELVEQLLDGEADDYTYDKRYLDASGRIVWVNLSASIVRDPNGTPLYFVSQIVDITERKDTERQLLTYAQRLARSNSELVEFASVAAHDLAEPLRVIEWHLQLLRDQRGSPLDDVAQGFIDNAILGAERLQALISDLLSYARSTDSRVTHAPVELDHVLAEAVEALRVRLDETHADITVDPLPVVRGNARQLTQVFQNLIANALNFTPPGRRPIIRITAVRFDEGWTITVADAGIGIPSPQREQVFGMFQRLHPSDDYHGNGIGLAICRRIIDAHGGRIWVGDSDIGTAMHLRLPAS